MREGVKTSPAGNVFSCAADKAVPSSVVDASNELYEQIDIGVRLQRAMLEEQFGVGDKTAKCDLTKLTQNSKIDTSESVGNATIGSQWQILRHGKRGSALEHEDE